MWRRKGQSQVRTFATLIIARCNTDGRLLTPYFRFAQVICRDICAVWFRVDWGCCFLVLAQITTIKRVRVSGKFCALKKFLGQNRIRVANFSSTFNITSELFTVGDMGNFRCSTSETLIWLMESSNAILTWSAGGCCARAAVWHETAGLVMPATTPIRCFSTRFLTPSLMQIFKNTSSNDGSR